VRQWLFHIVYRVDVTKKGGGGGAWGVPMATTRPKKSAGTWGLFKNLECGEARIPEKNNSLKGDRSRGRIVMQRLFHLDRGSEGYSSVRGKGFFVRTRTLPQISMAKHRESVRGGVLSNWLLRRIKNAIPWSGKVRKKVTELC